MSLLPGRAEPPTEQIAGECPVCQSNNLEHEASVHEDELLYYPVICNDCGFKGREWYKLEFIDFRDEAGKEITPKK